MIKEALSFLEKELRNYLSVKLNSGSEEVIKVGNIVKILDGDGDTSTNAARALISIVNIEEDRLSKSPDNYRKVDDKIVYKNPRIYLNLYLLIAAKQTDYSEALKVLSFIIQFFQHKSVFDIQNSPLLEPKIERLVLDLHTLNFEQMNHLWGILGGKYVPSVLYKMRVVGIEEEAGDSIGEPIMEIGINAMGKTQLGSCFSFINETTTGIGCISRFSMALLHHLFKASLVTNPLFKTRLG